MKELHFQRKEFKPLFLNPSKLCSYQMPGIIDDRVTLKGLQQGNPEAFA